MMRNVDFNFSLGILNQWDKIQSDIRSGIRTEFRSRSQILEDKSRKLGKYPSTWFLRGQIQNTFKVQITPNSALVNTLRGSLKDKLGAEGGKTNFVEMGGNLITSGLSKPEGFTGNTGCHFGKKCTIDLEEDSRVTRSIYGIECQNCLRLP